MTTFYVVSAILLFMFLLLSFFFSVSETAIIALSKLRIRHLVEKGVKKSRHLQNLVLKLDKLIAAILIGNNVVNISISVIVTTIFVLHFGYKWGSIISTIVSTLIILIFCEITPKILATKHTERIALFTAPLMEELIKLLNPIINFFIGISNFILRVFGLGTAKRSPLITEEELRLMIEVGKEEGVLSDDERKMLHRIFEFGDTKVGDVMVLKEKMVAVSNKATSEDVLNIFVEEGHARLPIYDGTIENIIGVIYARDLLYVLRDKGLFLLQDLIHPVPHIPLSLKVNDLLGRFQSDKLQIAIVVDEHKRTLGLVTLEDLLEEIVGEIEESHIKNHIEI